MNRTIIRNHRDKRLARVDFKRGLFSNMEMKDMLARYTQAERDALQEELIGIRRHLHQNPELSTQEFETTAYIKGCLAVLGVPVRHTNMKTGVIADIGSESKGKTIAIRADIDALPIQEKAAVSFASQNAGVMHACGHDFHTAALLGAVKLLKEIEDDLPGRIRFIFQPAEEGRDGALHVIADGQLDGVDAIIGIHNKPDLPVGTVALQAGSLMAAVDRFYVMIKGKGSHGALPHKGSDPVVTASHIVTALQSVVSRKVSPLDTAVISVTRIDGGNTWNVIPEEVVMEGTTRAFTSDVRSLIKDEFYEIVNHMAAAFGQKATIEWYPGPPSLVNNKELTERLKIETAKRLTVIETEPSIAGEDFAQYLMKVPGVFAFFGTNGTEDWHHPSFTVDETALILAAEYFATSALALLDS